MRDLVIWGATGQAKVIREALGDTEYRLAVLIDNRQVASPFANVPVLAGEAGLDSWLRLRDSVDAIAAVVAVGGARGRDRIDLMTLLRRRGMRLVTVVHRAAFVASDAVLGEGCQVLAQAAVCSHARLADGVIVNTAASVDHDCIIGEGSHLAPGARLAGEVTVGDRAFIGIGAVVLPRLRIGADAIVGAGAVVTRDVEAGETVVGNPARPRSLR